MEAEETSGPFFAFVVRMMPAKIPFFQEFTELHAALGLPYKSDFTEINLFHYEDAKSCLEHIKPYRTNFYQIFFIHHSDLTGNYNDTNIHFSSGHAYLFLHARAS
jgi:hypothetical protein